jgi:hypothetical protein
MALVLLLTPADALDGSDFFACVFTVFCAVDAILDEYFGDAKSWTFVIYNGLLAIVGYVLLMKSYDAFYAEEGANFKLYELE